MNPVCLVSAVAIFASSVSGSAQPESEQESLARLRELTNTVMVRVIAGDDAGAMELLRPNLPIEKAEFDSMRSKTIDNRRIYKDRYGKPVEYKLLREERVSDFLIRLTYVEKRTNHLLRWQFVFYRPKTQWRLNSFMWDDNALALFDANKAAK